PTRRADASLRPGASRRSPGSSTPTSPSERRLSSVAHARAARERRRMLLVICDGWGEAPPSDGNAIALARTPTFDRWRRDYPWTTVEASGEAVGLPAGLMGNSEVGHLNLGAGRMVPQDLLRVDLALRDGSFFENPALVEAADRARRPGATLHLMGLLSDGGVHSHERHLFGLLDLARARGARRIRVHAFTDGRDTPPRSALRR